jgi:metal-responsive CopG/Arc/MetJ family transcriptional regulator
MKVKTSVTLEADLVKAVDRLGGRHASRSETLERLVREGLAARARREGNARDLELINRHARALNAEVEDALKFQVEP